MIRSSISKGLRHRRLRTNPLLKTRKAFCDFCSPMKRILVSEGRSNWLPPSGWHCLCFGGGGFALRLHFHPDPTVFFSACGGFFHGCAEIQVWKFTSNHCINGIFHECLITAVPLPPPPPTRKKCRVRQGRQDLLSTNHCG